MSNTYPSTTPYGANAASTGSTDGAASAAKEQATQLGHETAAAGQRVGGVAKDEAKNVASEVKTQAKDLYNQTKGELAGQAGTQKDRVSSGLLTLSSELKSMANGEQTESTGVASDLVHQISSRVESVATWISDREPRELLDDVSAYARRKPGTFILIAGAVGLIAGRLTRSIVSEAKDEKDAAAAPTYDAVAPAYDTPTYDTVTPTPSTFVAPAVTTTYATGSSDGFDTAGGYGTTTGAGFIEEPILDPTTSGDETYLENPRS